MNWQERQKHFKSKQKTQQTPTSKKSQTQITETTQKCNQPKQKIATLE